MVRSVSLIAGVVILAFSTTVGRGASETDSPWVRGIFTGKSPRPLQVKETEAWQRASELAGRTPGAFVVVGGGESMLPLYSPGTILVMRHCGYDKLESGQTALYRNHDGKTVAHVLVTKARDGWRVAGLNNRNHDMEPVLARNLVGVVIAAFRPLADGRALHLASIGP